MGAAMQFFTIGAIVWLVVCGFFATLWLLVAAQVLLIVDKDTYVAVQRGKARWRVLSHGVHLRFPFWEKVRGYVPRDEQVVKWAYVDETWVLDEDVFWKKGPSSVYVVSVTFKYASNPSLVCMIALGGLNPFKHMYACVNRLLDGRTAPPDDTKTVACKVQELLKLDSAAHGYEVVSVSAYTRLITRTD